MEVDSQYRQKKGYHKRYEGVIPLLDRHYRETSSDHYRQKLEQYLVDQPCDVCEGKRLKPEAQAVRIGQAKLTDLTAVSIRDCLARVEALDLTPRQAPNWGVGAQRNQGSSAILARCGLRLSHVGSNSDDPIWRGSAADSTRDSNWSRFDGGAVRVG